MRTFLLVAVVFAGAPCALRAQWIAGADTLPAAAVADSQSVLKTLTTATRKNPNDAALRYRIGSIAWLLAVRSEFKPAVRGVNGPALKGLADSSFRLAVQLAPTTAKYELSLARFLRASSDPVLRMNAPGHADRAIEVAKSSGDTNTYFSAISERARLQWLDYDSHANRGKACTSSIEAAAGDISSSEAAMNRLHNAIIDCWPPFADMGDVSYIQAERLYSEAFAARPENDTAFRRIAMVYAEKNRWAELAKIARDRIRRTPKYGWAWLTLGLALHRDGESHVAEAVVDTAQSLLDPKEKARLFAFQRLLKKPDSARFVNTAAPERSTWENTFWRLADPLWSRKGNDPKTEFLARVTFAELRWTVEEYSVRGADSDRGEVHIRFGPPERVYSFRPMGETGVGDGMGGEEHAPSRPQGIQTPMGADVVTLWDYDIGFAVAFWGKLGYGTARIPAIDGPHVETALAHKSAAFDNVARERIIDMPLGLARFRGTGDSVDVVIFTRAPLQEIRSVTTNAPVQLRAWLVEANGPRTFMDSSRISGSGTIVGVRRVPPATYNYRAEVTSEGTMTAGRVATWITAGPDTATGFSNKGFGLSDVLLATAATESRTPARRWQDFSIAPLLGEIRTGGNLEVIWENYDIGARNGESRYAVSVTMQRRRADKGQINAALLGFAPEALNVQRRDDRVTFRFDRARPAGASAMVDHVSIALHDTPPGEYALVLEVTDIVTGRKTSRATSVTVGR